MSTNIKLPVNPSPKALILALLNSGNLDDAERNAHSWLASAPEDSAALYVMGLTCLLKGDLVDSVALLKKALAQEPANEKYLCNLGVAQHRACDIDGAILHLTKALKIMPGYTEAQYNLACAYIDNKQPEIACDQLSDLVKSQPDNANYICALGDALREMGKWNRAVKLYNQAIEKDPNIARAHSNLGPLLMHRGNTDDALLHCRKAIALDPANVKAHKNLGDCLVQMEQLEDAMEAYADAYEIEPESTELCLAIGQVWLETSDPGEASSWFQKVILLDDENIEAHCGLADIIKQNGNLPLALELLTPLLEKEPDNIGVLISMADTLWEDGDAETALEHLRHAQSLQPQRTDLYAKIGQILSSAGDVDQALIEYQAALEKNPNCIPALNGLAATNRDKLEISHVQRMKKLLENKKIRSGALASLHNGLAYYFDSKKENKKAAKHMEKANHHQWIHKSKRGWEYDVRKQESHVSDLIDTFNSDYFESVKGLGCNDESPVFIVAMPRSGTTLTEQILARHSKVLGVGERNFAGQSFNQFTRIGQEQNQNDKTNDFTNLKTINRENIASITKRYLAQLQQLKDKAYLSNALRVVDKMPDNYSLLGWIVTLFPNAKIIHANRDPRDVALSCWMTQFGSIRWACNQDHLVARIEQYQRLMEHWRKVLPTPILEMNYEDLIANQEQESRKLIGWIGLDWDPACLEFYDSDRLIRTASITQVRQPIYNKSVAKWKRYEQYIGELFNPLKPVLRE